MYLFHMQDGNSPYFKQVLCIKHFQVSKYHPWHKTTFISVLLWENAPLHCWAKYLSLHHLAGNISDWKQYGITGEGKLTYLEKESKTWKSRRGGNERAIYVKYMLTILCLQSTEIYRTAVKIRRWLGETCVTLKCF